MAILIVEHNGTLEGASLSGRVLIGRRGSNHVVVDHPAVSRIHAWIDTADDQFCVIDAGSRTGTFVNGQRVAGKVALSDGDRIGVGPASLIFRAHESLPAGVSQLDFTRRDNGSAPSDESDGGILFDCTCGAPLWIAAAYAGRLGKCRFCGAVVRVPRKSGEVATVVDVIPVAAAPAPGLAAPPTPPPPPPSPAINAVVATTTSTCGICQSDIVVGETSTTCASCGVTFHADCWAENFGCSSYGCAQVNVLAPPEPDLDPSAAAHDVVDAASASAAQAVAEVEGARKIPPEYALLSASLAGTLLGALTFGVPALVVLVVILVYLKRRRGQRPHRVVIVAAVVALVGIVGGAAASYLRWIDDDADRVHEDIGVWSNGS